MSPAQINAGDLVLVFARNAGDVSIDSCADTLGNNYAPAGATLAATVAPYNLRVFYSVAAFSGASPTVTVTFGGSTSASRRIYINRFTASGYSITPDGYNATNQPNSVPGPVDSGPITTVGAADLLHGWGMEEGVDIWTMDANFTDDDAGGNHRLGYALDKPAGTYHYQPTYSNNDPWAAMIAAFRADRALQESDGPASLLQSRDNEPVVGVW
jgi:hypothetical protein